jgi:hypothetical protein
MRHSILVLMLALALASPALAEGFVTGIDDLPLMAGLAEVPGSGIVFDKPEGRIVEAYASGAVSRDEVEAFYGATLPQLGWEPAAPGEWVREGERLSLTYDGAGESLTVRFSLAPR